MKRALPVILYTVLRLLVFLVPLVILLALGVENWRAALYAALIGLGISLIFLRRPRDKVALQVHEIRSGTRPVDTSDEDTEDSFTEAHSASATDNAPGPAKPAEAQPESPATPAPSQPDESSSAQRPAD